MKRSSRRRTRGGPRRATDWIGFHLDDIDGVVVSPALPQGYALVDGSDMSEKDGKLTIERVVGDVILFGPKDGAGVGTHSELLRYWFGLKVYELDQNSNIVGLDPDNQNDMEAQWMTIGHGLWSSETITTAGVTIFPYATQERGSAHFHIDVHVRRKLTEREILVFDLGFGVVLGAGGQGQTITASALLRMRTLVKLT